MTGAALAGTAAPACPSCRRGTIEVVADGRIGTPVASSYERRDADVRIVERARPFGACNACEFCVEIRGGAR